MRAMRPVSADDLRPSRDFDLRGFVIATLLGTVVTVAIWLHTGPRKNVGPTAATFDDAGRAFAFVFSVLVIAPGIALLISRPGGRLATAGAVILAVCGLSLLVLFLR
jgi:cation transport ATPase